MDNSPERRSEAYAPPTLRASDADRDRHADILRDALAEGRLSPEEHAERLDAALAAKTLGELAELVRDLPVPVPRPRVVKTPGDAAPARRAKSTMFAFWSGSTRKGRWRAGGKLTAIAVMGGIDIDLRDAVFDEPELVINVFALWGGIDIKVPEGVTIRDKGVGIMGGFDVHEHGDDDPHAPVVVIRGAAVMGGVAVKVKPRKHPYDGTHGIGPGPRS